jgi:hypothetical protein
VSSGESGATRQVGRLARLRLALIISALVLPADVLVGYARARIVGSFPGEYLQFGPAGAEILRGQLGSVYVDPANQAGPFELLPYGIASVLHIHGTLAWTGFYVVLSFLACLLLTSVILLPLANTRGRWVFYPTLGVAVLAILGSILPRAVFLGHPADVVIPLLWIAAGLLATRNRFAACGVLIAVSTGFEVWGILGAPVIFLATSPRVIRAALAGLVGLAVIYLPFIATGRFAMFGFHWTVDPGSLWAFVWPQLSTFPWSLRLAQAVLAIGAGVVTALLFRGNRFGPWAVPFAIVATRLLLDPLLLWYYWLAPATLALAALAMAIHWRAWLAAAVAAAVITMLWFVTFFPLLGAVFLFGVAVWVVVARRSFAMRVPESPNVPLDVTTE